jgi:antitoxin ParD1/3/4
MNISLTPELDDFVRQQVETGLYQSASEVVRDGLRLLMDREQIRKLRLDELRKKVAIGIEELDRGESVGMEELLHELRTSQDKAAE